MIETRTATDRAFGFAIYLASLVLISSLSIWCAIAVGGAAMTMIDTVIIDGSGQLGSDRESRRAAAIAIVAEPAVATQARALAAPTMTAPVQPPAVRPALPLSFEDDPAAKFHAGDEDTYRTFCVRLCDGYFWPVSFSTTSDRFARDQVACTSSCNSPVKLFVHKMPGGNASTMTTVDGLPYIGLKTAFLFRTNYDAQCKCQPQPWEQQALDRHRLHAATVAASKGNRLAAAAARELTSKVEADRLHETKTLLIATERANRELAALAKTAGIRAIASSLSEQRRKADSARATRIADIRRDGVMRLGGLPAEKTKSSWIPTSGSSRGWRDRAFNGN